MSEKIDQESEEYHKWKEGTAPKEPSKAEPLESESINEEVAEETIPEQPSEIKINKSFFDRIFKVKDDVDRMKKTYYLINFLIYYFLCCLFAYDALTFEGSNRSLPFVLLLGLAFSVFLPFVLLVLGFTISGGVFIGIFVGFFSWLLGLAGRAVYKLFGFDIDIIFPELVGKTGEVTKLNVLGKFSSYPFTATIENTGIYEDSIFYKNNFSIRSNEELKIGMKIKVITHEKRTLLSLIKNHPTLEVIPLQEQIKIEENKEEVVND